MARGVPSRLHSKNEALKKMSVKLSDENYDKFQQCISHMELFKFKHSITQGEAIECLIEDYYKKNNLDEV